MRLIASLMDCVPAIPAGSRRSGLQPCSKLRKQFPDDKAHTRCAVRSQVKDIKLRGLQFAALRFAERQARDQIAHIHARLCLKTVAEHLQFARVLCQLPEEIKESAMRRVLAKNVCKTKNKSAHAECAAIGGD